MVNKNSSNLLFTLTAKCRDCYRCLRSCSVKAIGVKDNQAYIDENRCISCGTCIRECPQNAKTYRNDIDAVRKLIEEHEKVAVSIAPSFAGIYGGWRTKRIPSALRGLGFSHISETSEGAYYVAQETKKYTEENGGGISSACPVVVSYIEKYKPSLIPNIIPIVSPMIAHGKILKQRLGADAKVVFIGPCIAKKREAEREEFSGIIDAVLTFDELEQWMQIEGIALERCEESDFDEGSISDTAKLFPIPGGLLKTAQIEYDGTQIDVLHTCGKDSVMEILELSAKKISNKLIEPLFCQEGCINGPGTHSQSNILTRRENLIAYSQQKNSGPLKEKSKKAVIELATNYHTDKAVPHLEISEEEIQKIFEISGKSDPEHQLNCGACGYLSCRENAEAVIMGMAEVEMCIPFMRRMAELRTDKIIETSPNGIVILDRDLKIIGMNRAFQKFFLCNNSIIGKKISYLIDASGFEGLVSGITDKYESIIKYNGLEMHQLLYALDNEEQYIGIYVDITGIQFNQKKIDSIKRKAIEQARELFDNQIKMAQNIATFLGESTAKSEDIVERLMSIYENED